MLLPLGKALGNFLNVIVNILIYISKFTAQIPFGFFTVKTPNSLVILEYYIMVYCIFKKRRIKEMLIIIIITIIILNIIPLVPRNLEINMIDVGQRRLYSYKNSTE